MTRRSQIVSDRNFLNFLLLLAFIALIFLAPEAAVNVDEQLHYPHAKKVVNWYFTGGQDQSCLHTPETNLKYYGQSVDNFTALINRVFHVQHEFTVRHYTGAVMFWLLLLGVALLALELSGQYKVAVVSVVLVMVMPRLFGQAFGNLKDIPFAAGYIYSILMLVRVMKKFPRPRWIDIVLLGAAIAFTSSVRIGGVIIFFYLGLAILIWLLIRPQRFFQLVSDKKLILRLLGQGLTVLIVGYFGGLLFWPYALQNVWANPLESLRVMEHYKVSIRQIFEGDLLWSTRLPHHYLIKWLAISTPEIVILGFLLFVYYQVAQSGIFAEKNRIWIVFCGFTFLFPVAYVIAIDSNLYSGVRQMLFVLPLLAIFAAFGTVLFVQRLKKPIVRYLVMAVVLILIALPVNHQVRTFPSDYIYFNKVSGGNKKAWSNYEYDYYFHGIKIASDYLKEIIGNETVVVAGNSNLSNYFDPLPHVTYRYVRYLERSSEVWDYGIFGINYIHPWQLKNNTWQSSKIIKTFYHHGNPTAVILKRGEGIDLKGITAMKENRREEADELFKKALADDPYNVWLYVLLAQNYYNSKSFDNFTVVIEDGLAIHPYYEPLYFLKAQRQFDTNDYEAAMGTLQKLMKINPRYGKAKPLLRATKEKLR